jgi:hypothetical protein
VHAWGGGNSHDGLPAVQYDGVAGAGDDVAIEDVEMAGKAGQAAGEATVFVNAANWPAGEKAWRPKKGAARVPFAGPGFQPVIVDLRD